MIISVDPGMSLDKNNFSITKTINKLGKKEISLTWQMPSTTNIEQRYLQSYFISNIVLEIKINKAY